MNNLSEHIKIRLKVYSELINKPEEEALYFALGVAKTVYEKGIKLPELIAETMVRSRYTIAMEIRQERIRERSRTFYQKNKELINLRRKELRELKQLKKVI